MILRSTASKVTLSLSKGAMAIMIFGVNWASVSAAEPEGIVISEVMWMGSDVSSADEWVELANVSSSEIDISGWRLTTKKGSCDHDMVTFKEGTAIGAGERFLVSNYDAKKSRLSIDPNVVDAAVSLPNTQLLLRLFDSGNSLVDEVDDGSGAPFAGRNTSPKASMERIGLLASGRDKSNWRNAVESVNMDEGVEIFATPGAGTLPIFTSSTSTSTSSASSSSAPTLPNLPPILSHIRIAELLPNPIGRDDNEWIELINKGESVVSLLGWELKHGSRRCVLKGEIAPGEALLVKHCRPKFSLKNGSGSVVLRDGSREIDQLSYPSMGEEISYGVVPGADVYKRYCVPTPGIRNKDIAFDPHIIVQTGKQTGVASVSINLLAEVSRGSLKNASCSWDYGDGFTSEACNPPSHTFRFPGHYTVRLTVKTMCSEQVERVITVKVLKEERKEAKEIKDGKDGIARRPISSIKTTFVNVLAHFSPPKTQSSAVLASLEHLIVEPQFSTPLPPASPDTPAATLPLVIAALQVLGWGSLAAYKWFI